MCGGVAEQRTGGRSVMNDQCRRARATSPSSDRPPSASFRELTRHSRRPYVTALRRRWQWRRAGRPTAGAVEWRM